MAKANKEGTCKFKVDTFKKLIKKKGLTMQDISLGIGKNRDYIASCCRQGKISNKSRLEIRNKFNIKLIVEKEVTDMVKCTCDMCGKTSYHLIKLEGRDGIPTTEDAYHDNQIHDICNDCLNKLNKQMEKDMSGESCTIKDILSTLITDMAVNGATFYELALVTKMSKDIMDILKDYKFEFYKEKYQGGSNDN